jgi:membrane peptidoglycan carboxypeptidase
VAWLSIAFLAGLVLVGASYEVRTSALQAWVLSRYAARLSFTIQPGPSPMIAFPVHGPFDERRGYVSLPESQRRLESKGYRVVEQARQSSEMVRLARWGITPPYREPTAVGLVVRDVEGSALYDARPGVAIFDTLDDVPPVIVNTLLFIENRDLARPGDYRNPAMDWSRFARAGALYLGNKLGLAVRVEGGSTLATQVEKYRHSAGGRTASPLDKLRQMAAASLRAYRDGPDTRERRRRVIVEYLNTMPLAAAPGRGEIYGLGEGLRAWFGLDPEGIARDLRSPGPSPAKARAYQHVLALLYAVRAPSYFLLDDRAALERKVAVYADRLEAARVIDGDLRRMMRGIPLGFRERPDRAGAPFVERKAVAVVRDEVRRLLAVPGRYELDRLQLEVESTVDGALQEAVTQLFRALGDPGFLQTRGLRGDPRNVVYSLMLLERTPEGNLLRAHADNVDAPFDVNRGMKLELGSTAKLRTLAHYLELMAALHGELEGFDEDALARRAATARDPITRWAAQTLRQQPGIGLDAFLGQALERTYPANPAETFFTGGGAHRFGNFDPADDGRVVSVRQALVRSVNLVFIRLMRDLVRFHAARLPYDAHAILTEPEPEQPDRTRLLHRTADEESRQFLARAYRRYRGLEPRAVVSRLLRERAASTRHQAILFFAWHPGADADALSRWLAPVVGGASADEVRRLARAYGNPRLSLADYGYLLGRHPLEVWCVGELHRSPGLSWDELLARSGEARRAASAWLFQTRHRRAQDLRLRTRIEQDAFDRMTPYWQRLGFPFERLVPSYATAIGSSSDRPAALAELMGIIVNDGLRRPTRVVRRLRFAADTPYHTVLEPAPPSEERVLAATASRVSAMAGA